jgi:glucose/arabinose dehydrogenase
MHKAVRSEFCIRFRVLVSLAASGLMACSDSRIEPTPFAKCVPVISGNGLMLVELAKGASKPFGITAFVGGDATLVLEREGTVRALTAGGVIAEPLVDVRKLAGPDGLRGFAFHPGYLGNGRMFVSYINKLGDSVIAEYLAAPGDFRDARFARFILLQPHMSPSHNGGSIVMDQDGLLYIAFGDDSSANDRFGFGQNPWALQGKLLRINVDASANGYAIPADNPWADGSNGAPEMFAWGLRNPTQISIDQQGSVLVADRGQSEVDEVNLVFSVIRNAPPGLNFGWPITDGERCFVAGCDQNGFVAPAQLVTHVNRDCGIIGGHRYDGTCMPALERSYFFGDECSSAVRLSNLSMSGEPPFDLTSTIDPEGMLKGQLSGFGVGGDGELYLTTNEGGRIFRVQQRPRI